jgi:hypothetical protein
VRRYSYVYDAATIEIQQLINLKVYRVRICGLWPYNASSAVRENGIARYATTAGGRGGIEETMYIITTVQDIDTIGIFLTRG